MFLDDVVEEVEKRSCFLAEDACAGDAEGDDGEACCFCEFLVDCGLFGFGFVGKGVAVCAWFVFVVEGVDFDAGEVDAELDDVW